jgi:hypothetical protein
MVTIRRARAVASTSASTFGATIRRPPASATRAQSAALRTVPAPIRQSLPKRWLRRSIEAKGSGEFSGTSISSKPLSIRASTMDSASSGRMPRRMAMSGRFTVGHEAESVIS